MQTIDAIDLGDAQRRAVRRLNPFGQRASRGRGGADGVEREQCPCEPSRSQSWRRNASKSTIPSRKGVAELGREAPELDQPRRNDPPAVKHETKSAADGSMSQIARLGRRSSSRMRARRGGGRSSRKARGAALARWALRSHAALSFAVLCDGRRSRLMRRRIPLGAEPRES